MRRFVAIVASGRLAVTVFPDAIRVAGFITKTVSHLYILYTYGGEAHSGSELDVCVVFYMLSPNHF